MADLTPEQIRELDTLTAPRPAYDLNGLVGLENGLSLKMPGAPAPDPYQPIPAGAGYQMQVDPMTLSHGEAGNGGDPGLGLGGSRIDWGATLGGVGSILEAASAGYFGREPLFMKQQARQDQLQQQAALRREAIAQQQEQLAEQKKQHQFQQATGVFMNKDLPWSQKKKALTADQGNPYARVYSSIGDEKLAADFENVVQYLDKSDLELFKKDPDEFVRSVGGLAGVEAKLETAKERQKLTAKETEENRLMDGLFAKYRENPDSLTTMEFERLDKHVAAQEDRKLKKKELEQRIKNLGLEGQHKEQELARGKAPIVSPGYVTPGGETEHIITDPTTGQRKTVAGVPASTSNQKVTTMSSPAIEATVDSRTLLDQIGQLKAAYKKEYVGPIDNLWAGLRETAPGVFGPIAKEEGEFRKKVNQVLLTAKKLNIGTAQSAAETESFVKAYMNLGQNDTVFESAIEGLREMTRTSLQVRSRLMTEIASGQRKPLTIPERSMQLASLVSVKGFAKDADEAKQIARDTLMEEIQLGLVKGY